MPFSLYYATAPAPADVTTHDALTRLIPVTFSTEKDAIHAAALVIRGGQFVWLIEGPGVRYTATEVEERCRPILSIIGRRPSS